MTGGCPSPLLGPQHPLFLPQVFTCVYWALTLGWALGISLPDRKGWIMCKHMTGKTISHGDVCCQEIKQAGGTKIAQWEERR
jgi:hypothetical protein